jgi:hypothetical protein
MLGQLADWVWAVVEGLALDIGRALLGWAGDHTGAALAIGATWFGVGRWAGGAGRYLLPRQLRGLGTLIVIAAPPFLLWAALRRTKNGRRGIAAAAPTLAALLIIGMWRYAPDSRRVWVLAAAAALIVGAATLIDEWTAGEGWTRQAFRRALQRDDARHAIAVGVQSVAPGSRVGRPTRSGAGWAVPVDVPTGTSPAVIARAAEDETLGATATAAGVPLGNVTVAPGKAQGKVSVVGWVAGQPHPLDEAFPYPHQEQP